MQHRLRWRCAHGLMFGYLAWAGCWLLAERRCRHLSSMVSCCLKATASRWKSRTLVDDLEKPPTKNEHEDKSAEEREQKDPRGQVVDITQPAIEQRPDQPVPVGTDSTVLREQRPCWTGQAGVAGATAADACDSSVATEQATAG